MIKIFRELKTVAFAFAILLTALSFSRLHYNIFLFEIIITESFILMRYVLWGGKKNLVLLILTFLSLVIILKLNYYDKELFNIGGLEQYQLQQREGYYKREAMGTYQSKLSNIYLNSKKVYLDKVVGKTASVLQPNLYFYSKLDSAYPLFLLPFFFLGALLLLSRYRNLTLIYIFGGLFIAIFIETSKSLLLFLPLINLAIFLGLTKIVKYLKLKLT